MSTSAVSRYPTRRPHPTASGCWVRQRACVSRCPTCATTSGMTRDLPAPRRLPRQRVSRRVPVALGTHQLAGAVVSREPELDVDEPACELVWFDDHKHTYHLIEDHATARHEC